MKWEKEDLSFLKQQRDFCVDYTLKGLELRESALILGEIIKNVERKDNKRASKRKLIVRWC
jgi:hypothetical protein